MAPKRLTPDEITPALASVPEWKHEGDAIQRQLVFRDFREAVAFLVHIAFDAEEADHHPDVTLNYKRLTLSLSTHSEGGLTAKDFDLAKKIDAIFGNRK
jgi:4a-hydroxytetrahydrobiopterin dehydratase